MNLAPIALFVYNRPWHTQQTVEALQKNILADQSDLFIFSDAPKNDAAKDSVAKVRSYINKISGFKSIKIIEQQQNLGLANSIISSVTEVVNKFGKIVVMEDDLISSPYFLKFMNDGLNFYENEEKVISIHGYIYPIKNVLPETFFIKGADCWGWATWKRGWDLFETNGEKLLKELEEKKILKHFNFNGSYNYVKMLKDHIAGKNDSWAIRWYASALVQDKLTLYLGKSLIANIGIDNSGIHSGKSKIFDVTIAQSPVEIKGIKIEESEFAYKQIVHFLKTVRPNIFKRIITKLNGN